MEIMLNAQIQDIRDDYKRSSIFWYACGLDEEGPEKVEYFGMTTVGAMQNCSVPIVIDGGGQREIVEHGDCGFRFGEQLETLLDSAEAELLGRDMLSMAGREVGPAGSH